MLEIDNLLKFQKAKILITRIYYYFWEKKKNYQKLYHFRRCLSFISYVEKIQGCGQNLFIAKLIYITNMLTFRQFILPSSGLQICINFIRNIGHFVYT